MTPSDRTVLLRYIVYLLVVYACWIGLYYLTAWIGALRGPTLDVAIGLDEDIPYLPGFQYTYMLAYIIPLGLLIVSRDPAFLDRAYRTFILANVTAFIVFAVCPVQGPVRDPVDTTGSGNVLISLIFAIDSRYNAFPSLHVTNPWLVALFALKSRGLSILGVSFLLLAVIISISTLFVRQHYILDVVAGMALAFIYYLVVGTRHTVQHSNRDST